MNLMRAWIERKLEEIAGVEDEVVVNYILSELEANDEKGPDPKTLEICLQGNFDHHRFPRVSDPGFRF